MTEELYTRYVEQGPDAMKPSETRAVLDWRDANPAEAHRVRERLATERREALDKEALRSAWLHEGGSEKDFEAAHREISAEAKREKLAAMDREAREASARAIVTGF